MLSNMQVDIDMKAAEPAQLTGALNPLVCSQSGCTPACHNRVLSARHVPWLTFGAIASKTAAGSHLSEPGWICCNAKRVCSSPQQASCSCAK